MEKHFSPSNFLSFSLSRSNFSAVWMQACVKNQGERICSLGKEDTGG